MHRLITNAKPGEIIDHINRNSLDNRKCNLRKCSNSQNQWNTVKQKNNKSGFKGVYWNKEKEKWQAQISFGKDAVGKQVTFYLGRFDNVLEAAAAYDKKAKELHGKFARLNLKQPIPNKQQKPEGWQPPDILGELKRQGWKC